MSKKEKFIAEVESMINSLGNFEFSPEAETYWQAFKTSGEDDKEKKRFTENGAMVLHYLQNNKDTYSNLFKAKDVGDEMGVSSRTVSGAMRKLKDDGYVEKLATNPVVYSLTELGESVDIDAE